MSRRETSPLGERLRLPVPTMVVVREYSPPTGPVVAMLAVVGYRPVVDMLWVVDELVE
jgi:hypothetical protein